MQHKHNTAQQDRIGTKHGKPDYTTEWTRECMQT